MGKNLVAGLEEASDVIRETKNMSNEWEGGPRGRGHKYTYD